MKTAAATIAILATLTSTITAKSFRAQARQADTSIEITFNGARNDGATIQAVGVMWPVDGSSYTMQDVATNYPAAQYVNIPVDQRVQNAEQSISTGDIVNDGTKITCIFAGLDGTTHSINNWPTDGDDVMFTIGAPTAFTSAECHAV